MILVAICTFIVTIVSFFLTLIPNMRIDMSSASTGSFYTVLEHVGAFVPVTQLGIILGIVALIYGAEFLWLLLNWMIAKIPFID